jgi:hypothetical protein
MILLVIESGFRSGRLEDIWPDTDLPGTLGSGLFLSASIAIPTLATATSSV